MKKIFFLLLFVFLTFLPNLLKAEETNDEKLQVLSQTVKYYKTISNSNSSTINNYLDTENKTITIEITEEEYNNANVDVRPMNFIETTYKKLISTIYQNGSYYRYSATLTWKNIPSTRSYDIMGIGFYRSVKILNNNVYFYQDYCQTNGTCKRSSTYVPQVFDGGAGVSFKIPDENLTSLSQTIYFDVTKNSTGTVVSQLAAADYAHATKTITMTNSKKYTVNSAGITLNGISSYYDSINTANTTWNGSW